MRVLSLAFMLIIAAIAQAQPVSDEEKKDGFVPLFNGKDFEGLRFSGKSDAPPKNWSVADGMIKLSGGGNPHLATQWPYSDFDVRIQWKALKKGYNSGFYVRSGRSVGANQINLAQKAAGNLMGGAKGGVAVPELQKDPGEWNDWRVLAVGDKLTFWCNGKQAWEVTGFKPASGYIGIQAEGAAIDFKNLRVKEIGFEQLSDSEPKALSTISTKVEKDYVLRLEHQSEKASFVLKGTNATLDLKDVAAKNAVGAKEWNYLEIAVRRGMVEVWQNGETIHKGGAAPSGDLALTSNASTLVRNVRIQRLQ
ncbi:MAG: DUF1080 domain-containing protein [Gemmataceae bacterium]|nr:DUF1080 domain-containing protein [Gemmataceae bacterium]